MEKTETVGTGLKPWIIAAAIIFPPISYLANRMMIGFTTWWIWPSILPPSVVVFIMLLYALTKGSSKFKISAQEWACLLTIFWMTAGTTYLQNNVPYWTISPLPTYNVLRYVHGLYFEPYKEVFWERVPAYMAPKDAVALENFYVGGTYDVGPWLPSIIFWISWSIIVYCGSYLWTFFLRKPLIETEVLPFPSALPSIYAVKWYVEEENRIPKLFNFKLKLSKLFWIGIIIGALIYVPNTLSALTPIPIETYVNVIPFDFNPITMNILPGAEFNSYWPLADSLAATLFPLDVLATAIVYWFIFGVIYPVIGVKTGLLPYTPGVSEYGQYASSVGPFKRNWFSMLGIPIGLGVWILWNYRKRIIEMFNAALFPEKYPNLEKEDQGVSYRLIVFGSIVSLVALMGMFIAGGTPIIMAIIGPLLFFVVTLGWVRIAGEGSVAYAPNYHDNLRLYFDIGTALGQWGPRPDPAAFNSVFMWANFGNGSRMASYSVHGQFLSYKIGAMLKTRAKDIFWVSMITMVSIAISVQALYPWWYTTFAGYQNQGTVEYHAWDIGGVWSLTYGTPTPPDALETAMYAGLGIVACFVIFWLRGMFTWFFINPVGFQIGGPSWWMIYITAFIIKYITLKVGGVRAWEEYLLPTVVGLALGNGVIQMISSWIAFFTRAIPNFPI